MKELDSPGYERVEGETLENIMEGVSKRQQEYLNSERLPTPREYKTKDGNDKESILLFSSKLPVRYLMPKLHKELPAFRGITACCGTTTEGKAKLINAVLVGLDPY